MTKEEEIYDDDGFQEFDVFDTEVQDLGCAAALSLAGFPPVLTTGGSPWKFSFVFQPIGKVADMIVKYKAGTLEVKARAFFAELETLRSQVDDRGPGGIIYEEIKRNREKKS